MKQTKTITWKQFNRRNRYHIALLPWHESMQDIYVDQDSGEIILKRETETDIQYLIIGQTENTSNIVKDATIMVENMFENVILD